MSARYLGFGYCQNIFVTILTVVSFLFIKKKKLSVTVCRNSSPVQKLLKRVFPNFQVVEFLSNSVHVIFFQVDYMSLRYDTWTFCLLVIAKYLLCPRGR